MPNILQKQPLPQKKTPTTQSERIVSLDILRGFALLGILLMNISAFSMPAATYFAPVLYGDLSGLNLWIWGINHLLADMKFMSIFSMLFGAGIVLMNNHQRKNNPDQPSLAALHYRRMIWLIVFGLLHAHLLWHGDILYSYGMCGLIAYHFRHLAPKKLIICGVLLLAIPSIFTWFADTTLPYWPPAERQKLVDEMTPPAQVLAEEVAAYQEGWLGQMQFRTPNATSIQIDSFIAFIVWRVTGLMLLGMALFKLGFFSMACTTKTYVSFILLAIVIGMPMILYGIFYNFSHDWQAPHFFFIGLQFNYWGSILVSLGWVSVIMLLCQSDYCVAFKKRLAAVGQMAFSNYILQTLICTSIFYGHGLGLFGQVERSGQLAIVIAIWLLQLAYTQYWLDYFRYGPLEWLWRSLVYLRLQTFTRSTAKA